MLPSKMNTLVQQYRTGDQRAIEQVYKALRSYFGKVARRYGDQTFYDGWEAFSDAEEAFVEALRDWDPEAGYRYFYHYAKQRVKWRVSTNRNKAIHRQKLAYQTPVSHTELLHQDRYDRVAQAEAAARLHQLSKLTGKVADMVRLKAQGLSNVQVGKEMGMHNSYISRKMKELEHAV